MTPAPKIAGVNLTSNPPHNTRIEVNFGSLSVLFSYGSPIGYDYLDGPQVLNNLNRHQQKHANQWRRWNTQKKVTHYELVQGFLSALSSEAESIRFEHFNTTTPEDTAMTNFAEPARLDSIDEDLDELDEQEDDDLDDDLDDDDDEGLDDEDDDGLDDDDEEDDEDLDFDDDEDDDDEDEPDKDLKDGEY